ncbi:MAG TPA: serine/threonine-protein kinase, partial [Aggregatilineales bacterium]|nr:serine/threonine-protein kinase [Aggregatilineales bacterium]
MIGQTLKDRYRIEKLIGAGAMGQVFRATDLETFDEVAVKTISVERAANQDDRRRFQREVSALQHLNHPHIARYIDAFDLGTGSFLVIEYCGGGTLKQYIQSHEMMPKRVFKDMALKITDAIASAHEVGIIHRDLKPENILLTEAGEPKVVDFGLARLSGVTTMTQAGTLMGTLAYMPPEAFDPVLRQDHRGDIWALGIIFFQMLTGDSPFRSSSQSGMISAILSQKPAPLHQLRTGLPHEWGDILLGCLEKHPNNRYPTARHLLE